MPRLYPRDSYRALLVLVLQFAREYASNARFAAHHLRLSSEDLAGGIELARHISNNMIRGNALRRIAAEHAESRSWQARDLLAKALAAFRSASGADLDLASQYVALSFNTAHKMKNEELRAGTD